MQNALALGAGLLVGLLFPGCVFPVPTSACHACSDKSMSIRYRRLDLFLINSLKRRLARFYYHLLWGVPFFPHIAAIGDNEAARTHSRHSAPFKRSFHYNNY